MKGSHFQELYNNQLNVLRKHIQFQTIWRGWQSCSEIYQAFPCIEESFEVGSHRETKPVLCFPSGLTLHCFPCPNKIWPVDTSDFGDPCAEDKVSGCHRFVTYPAKYVISGALSVFCRILIFLRKSSLYFQPNLLASKFCHGNNGEQFFPRHSRVSMLSSAAF